MVLLMARKNTKPRKKTNRIANAQRDAVEARLERDTLRRQASAENARLQQEAKDKANQEKLAEAKRYVDPHTPKPPVLFQYDKAHPEQNNRATSIPGLELGVGYRAPKPSDKKPLADPSLYGKTQAARAATIARQKEALDAQKFQQLAEKDQAVYMGPGTAVMRRSGPQRMDEFGSDKETVAAGDNIQRLDDLMGWLADPQKVAQIKQMANQAGLNVQTFDDIQKLWTSVVTQAAQTYSRTKQKVTPMALIALRGKYVGPDGNMQNKVTTSTQIDEMDPATARSTFEQAAASLLGRAPTEHELQDFIAKAQQIAKENPSIATTTSKVGFDGQVEEGTSQTVTRGGADVVKAKAEQAALDQAKQSEDYGAYQAAGTYFPLLFDALSSPV